MRHKILCVSYNSNPFQYALSVGKYTVTLRRTGFCNKDSDCNEIHTLGSCINTLGRFFYKEKVNHFFFPPHGSTASRLVDRRSQVSMTIFSVPRFSEIFHKKWSTPGYICDIGFISA